LIDLFYDARKERDSIKIYGDLRRLIQILRKNLEEKMYIYFDDHELFSLIAPHIVTQ